MNQLTTIAALPMGAGCLSRLEPEVGKSPPKTNSDDHRAAVLASLGYKVNAQGMIERL